LRTVELHEVTEIIAGQSPKSEFYIDKGEGVPFFQGKADFGDIYPTVSTWCTKPKKMAKEGDILFSVRAPVGPTNIAKVDCCIGRGLSAIRAGNDIDRSFLRYFFKKIEQQLSDQGRGSTFKAITQKDLKALKIPLPSLSEQKAIVAKLDRAQRLIDIDKAMLAKYDQLIQSVFLEMFGDPVTNPKGWEKGTIRDLVNEVRYGTSKKAHVSEGEYPVIRMGNLLYNGEWDFTDLKYCDLEVKELPKYLVHKGDVLFNRTNSKELVGKTGVYREDVPMAYAGYLIRVRPNDLATSDYISGFLNCQYGKLVLENMCKNIVGMANINAQELQDIEILIPPITLQKEYEFKIQNFRKEKDEIRFQMIKSEALFSSLVQEVFN